MCHHFSVNLERLCYIILLPGHSSEQRNNDQTRCMCVFDREREREREREQEFPSSQPRLESLLTRLNRLRGTRSTQACCRAVIIAHINRQHVHVENVGLLCQSADVKQLAIFTSSIKQYKLYSPSRP
ncbi:hypothetical protein GOODEAATRI_007188 [Goodea atripinnis]|uniref:Uncharacterized protein n=1 Tax=Goodea atripinnis TaxID=208336 RepID=A0ABV0N0V5_9TELE